MRGVLFCRYTDDGLLHCKSRKQSEFVMARIMRRFKECGLKINAKKLRIVYCKGARCPEAMRLSEKKFMKRGLVS